MSEGNGNGNRNGAAPPMQFDLLFQDKMIRTLFKEPDFCCAMAPYLNSDVFDGKIRRWLAGTLLNHAQKHGCGASFDAVKIRLQKDLKIGRLRKNDAPEAEEAVLRLKRGVRDRSFVKEATFEFVKNQVARDVILNSIDHLKTQDHAAIQNEMSRYAAVDAAFLKGGMGQFYVRDVEQRVARRKDNMRNGVSSGTAIDSYMSTGGLWPKALGCFMGAWGSGKTSSLISISRAAIVESGAKVLYVTMELDEDAVCERFDAGFADVSLSDIGDDSEAVLGAVQELGTKHGEFLVVKEFPPKALDVPGLRAYMRRLESTGFYPNVLVVDSAELMKPSDASMSDSTYEEQGGIYVELRGLVMEKSLVAWTCSQLNREGVDRELATSKHAADSAKKAHTSDLIVVLNQTPKEKKAGIGRLYLDKNRKGPVGIEIPVSMDWSRARIYDRGA